MGPRFFQTVILERPTYSAMGDAVISGSTLASGSVWHRRAKSILGGAGEVIQVTATGFLASNTDVRPRDRLTVSGTSMRFEVVNVVSGYDDRGRVNHVGVELRDI